MITIYIYDEKLNIIAKPLVNSYEEFMSNPQEIYQEWDSKKHIADTKEFKNPVIVDGELRDKKREEEILLDGKIELLYPGEIIKDGKIEKVEISKGLYKPLWQSPIWIEGAPLEECIEFKRVELKNCREYENNASYQNLNKDLFDADESSKNRMERAEKKYRENPEEKFLWVTADNKTVDITHGELKDIITGIYTRKDRLYRKFTDKLDIIINAKNIEEVKQVIWEA
ncbi:MAG: DUF4376 domain-containing protein [Fusobacteriaceae bacterium]